MKLLIDRLKEISAFIYILVFLLIFNFLFNLNYSWYGVSLIVRVYLFVVSFYLIFGFASLKISDLRDEYSLRYGVRGEYILFLESRLVPLAFIYLITILFTFIDYIRLPDWPWNPIVSLLNGRYSNLVIYSVFLLLILKLKREPRITIPLFLLASVLYFFIDKFLFSAADNGLEISAIKFIKLMIFFLIPFMEFFSSKIISVAGSFITSIIIFFAIIFNFLLFYKCSDSATYINKESGLQLVSSGITSSFDGLEDIVIRNNDYGLFKRILELAGKYTLNINFTEEEWKSLLFAAPDDSVELISGYLINRDIGLTYLEIISFVEKRSEGSAGSIENLNKFTDFSSRHVAGNEDDLMKRMKSGDRGFRLWGISVLGKNRCVEAIPLLVEYLTDIDIKISERAYYDLKMITGLDPSREMNKKINDPDVIIIFKKYYLERRSSRKAD
ncbi:MAG: hypothetical protein MUC95_00045 [Spirochaetes bacterium]|jgi:hypothetical protein|nr:hypothetical protein [Spirochaetota bacterium]